MDDHTIEHTFLSLVAWTKSALGKAGMVIIMAQQGDKEKLEHYINKLNKLETALFVKAGQVRDEDRVDDLRIMEDKVRILREHMMSYKKTLYSRAITNHRSSMFNGRTPLGATSPRR